MRPFTEGYTERARLGKYLAVAINAQSNSTVELQSPR